LIIGVVVWVIAPIVVSASIVVLIVAVIASVSRPYSNSEAYLRTGPRGTQRGEAESHEPNREQAF
jgi:hypothetical protein